MDVALVTCRKLPEPDPDAAPLARALNDAGIAAKTVAWDDDGERGPDARLTVFRSSWNYPQHHQAFLAWSEAVAARSELWNPLHVVRWNTHKGYLIELERKGLSVTPTLLLPRGDSRTLGSIMLERGWAEVVVKPAISAASYRTLKVGPGNAEEGERHLRELAADGDVLVQLYLSSVEDYGERALIWIDGQLTHAVRKSPRFAGQDESVSDAMQISVAEAELAQQAVAAVAGPLLYARIDVAPGPDGTPVIMELELVEPSLFFVQFPPALERFVAAIRARL